MAKPTLREIYTSGLLAVGARPLQARSSKYHTFYVPDPCTSGEQTFRVPYSRVYLGKAGAFRVGKNVTDSMDASRTTFHKEILRLGQLAHGIAPEDEKVSL